MAKSALELAVNTGQWDAGLKKAQQSLNNFTEASGGLQQALAKDSENIQKFVRMMGNFESTAKTAKGQMNDYKSAIEQLTMQYNRMTDAQKKTIGQDYLSSIDKLKQKYQGVQESVNSMNKELSGGGGLKDALNSVAGQFGLNIEQLTKFGGVLAATGAALKVAKDAFFASEATVDEWGRTVAASESVYEGFLNALNNMDISGFLGRIDEIVTAARKAYDELDRLGTMKTIQSPAMSAQQTENERMRAILQTGRWIGAADGRQSSLGYKNGDIVSKEHLKIIEQQLKNGMNNMVTLVGREVKQTTKAIDAVYERQGAELGMSVKEFRKGTSSMAEFDKRIALAAKYNEYESQHTNTVYNPATGRWSPKRDNSKNPYEAYKGWDVFRVDGDRYKGLVQLIQQRDQQMSQMYGMQSQAYRTINRVEGTTVRNIMNGGSGGGKGSSGGKTTTAATEKEVTIQQQIAKLEQEAYTASDERRAEIAKQVQELDKVLAKQKAIRDEVHGIVKEQAEQKRLADAQNELVEAQASGDLKKIYAAEKKVETAQVHVDAKTGGGTGEAIAVPITISNLDALKQHLTEEMATMPVGDSMLQNMQEAFSDASAIGTIFSTAVKNGIDTATFDTSGIMQKLLNGEDIGDDTIQEYVDQLNKLLKEKFDETEWPKVAITFDVKTKEITNLAKQQEQHAKKLAQDWSVAGQAINAVGNAMSQIEDPAIKVMGTIAQAVASVALGAAQAIASPKPWPAWIAFAAAATATMITTINSIHSATGYAEGGIIKGNSFSGDNIPADTFVNAGELVLNRAQQGALAQQLEGGRDEGMSSTPYVTGEQIYLGLNNYLKGAGYGQLVTSKS